MPVDKNNKKFIECEIFNISCQNTEIHEVKKKTTIMI